MRVNLFRSLPIVWISILPSMAAAQARDPVGAEKLFTEARSLLDDGKYAEACQKLADSQQLDPGVGTLLNLAQCYVKIGKTATAWALYREAADAARATGQTDREKKALRAAEALEPDLAKCTITVPDIAASKEVEVKRNGVVVPKSLWGVSEPVDPGEYVIEGRTRAGKIWSTRVKAEVGRVAIVVLPAFEDDPSVTGAPTTTIRPVGSQGTTNHGDAVGQPQSSTARSWTLIGESALSVAGAVVGVCYLMAANSAEHNLDGARSRIDSVHGNCTMPNATIQGDCATLASRANDPDHDRAIATAGFVTAGVAAAAFVTTWIVWKPTSGPAISLHPVMGRRMAGLELMWRANL